MNITMSLLVVILGLFLVIGVHEAGHAIAASFFKVKIKTISIGFGKALIKWQSKGGCQWQWALWPLGGYVKLLNTRIEPVSSDLHKFAFDKKPVWVRCIILLSGAMANIMLAWLALLFMHVVGYQQITPIIGSIKAPSIASAAGFIKRDQFISVGGVKVASWREVGMQLIMAVGQDNVLVVVKNGLNVNRNLSLDLKNLHLENRKDSLLLKFGIKPALAKESSVKVLGLPIDKAAKKAFLEILNLVIFFLVIIKNIITGIIPFGLLLGPLGIFNEIVASFKQGVAVFLYFIANFSISVALINLFPIPSLDGGSIVLALIEKIRRRPVSIAMEILLNQLILIVFSLLLVQLILNDLHR